MATNLFDSVPESALHSLPRSGRGACVVVDAYSTGNALAGVFRGYGFESAHVWSRRDLPDVLTRTFRGCDFAYNLTYDGDLEALCARLLQSHPSVACVVAASESGVILADLLSERLGVPSNGSALSAARRDKSVMARTVAAAGVPVIPHLASSDATEIRRWIAEHRPGPVILKPTAGAGTLGFHICVNDEEAQRTLVELLGTRDVFGATVEEVIVQPFVGGEEFCVNAVSHDGRHLVTEVWRTRKQRCGDSKVYDLETLVEPTSAEYPQLVDYVSRVLTALGIAYGPSHTEVIVGPSGPLLIESAARFMGTMDISLVSRARGTNAVLLTAEAYLAPERFRARFDEVDAPLACQAATVTLVSPTAGRLERWNLDAIRALKSFYSIDTFLKPGDPVVPTVDSFKSPGVIFLAAPTEAQLRRDYLRIRTLEADGQLYEVSR